MSTFRVKGLSKLGPLMLRHAKQRSARLKGAYARAMRRGAEVVRANVPVAFSELRDGIEADAQGIHIDAAHAAAVEEGSRPHMPPIEPLIEWVKLRHLQSQIPIKSRRRLPGKTTMGAAKAVAKMMKPHHDAGLTDDEAAERVAWAIARKIASEGTDPTWFLRRSLPQIRRFLDAEVKRAMPDRE